MYRGSKIVLLILVVACSEKSTSPIPGDPVSAIVAGNNQVVTADYANTTKRLPDPVVQQMVRTTTTGAVRLVAVSGSANAGDTMTLNGSPVPGAVVCSAGGNGRLTAFSPCTSTDAQGKAFFVFEPSTTAGEATSEIRGYLNGEAVVFDTAVALITPGAVDSLFFQDAIAQRTSPATFMAAHLMDRFDNSVPYRIPADARLTPVDTVLGSTGARTVTFVAAAVDSTWRTLMLTGEQGVAIAQFAYRLVFGTNGAPRIQATMCGLKKQCVSALWAD